MAWLICGILSAINAGLSFWLPDMGNFWLWATGSPLQFLNWKYLTHTKYTDLIGWFLVGLGGREVCLNLVRVFGG